MPHPVARGPRTTRRRRTLAAVAAGTALAAVGASSLVNLATSGGIQTAQELYPGPYVTIEGRQVAYRDFGGSGPPIVLVGGFVEASWVWQQVGQALAGHHRVMALDLAPFGYSERRGPYTLAAWTATTWGFAQHFGLDSPMIVGHSLGAAVAVSVARTHPGEVSGVVLVDGDALSAGRGGAVAWLARVEPFATTAYRLVTRSDALFRRALALARGPGAPPADPAEVQAWQRPFRVAGTQQAFAELVRGGVQGFTPDELAPLAVPATVVWGGQDSLVPQESGLRTAQALDAPLVVIPGAGHLSPMTHPQQVAAAIEAARRRPGGR